MKKMILTVLVFSLMFVGIWGQSWTVRSDEAKCDWEYIVITKTQFERLVRQYEAGNECCIMKYTDVLEMREKGTIISGERPIFDGYYYLLVITKLYTDKLTQEERNSLSLINMSNALAYGNSTTGIFSMIFTSEYGSVLPDAVWIDSSEYTERYNQFIEFVNGE